MDDVTPLSEIRIADADRFGRKAAVLGELSAAGFDVPDGFVIGWSVGAHLVDAAASDPERVRTLALPDDLIEALTAALAGVNADAVAVRSSGVDEDLEGKSFAGQYDSVLDVRGPAALFDAVRECWASGFSERVGAYSDPGAETARVGVLVQAMVPADAAGAAFGANPVTGDRDEVVLSAVPGLGEALMSGSVVADEWSIRAGIATRTSGDADAIDAEQAVAIAELVANVERTLTGPQDIEWAVADGRLCLLQARPITTLDDAVDQYAVESTVPPGFSVRDDRTTNAWTPMQTSVFLPVFDAAAPGVFAYLTGANIAVNDIGGWIYTTTPADTMPALISRLEKIADALDAEEPYALVRQWHDRRRSEFVNRVHVLRDVDRPALDDSALAEHLESVRTVFAEIHVLYFRLTGAAVQLNGEVGLAASELLDWTPAHVMSLRGGLRGIHTAAAVGLSDLARIVASRPELRSALTADLTSATENLSEIDPDFAARFADFVRDHGHRSVEFDLHQPTLAEQPEILLSLVLSQTDSPFDIEAERAALQRRTSEALAAAHTVLAGRSDADRARFDRALAANEAAIPIRDEKVYVAVSVWAQLRYAIAEVGARLSARGQLFDPDDVFFLEWDEMTAALDDGEPRTRAARIGRGRYRWITRHRGPDFHGTPPTPLALEPGMTPPSSRAEHVMDVTTWAMGLMRGGVADEPTADGVLAGVAASAGRYTGPARVVRDTAEFAKIRRGDVLICPETTAQWSVVFPSLGALVADRGSLLSHPAIIAREYGIPAVVAVGDGTSTISDGQLVEVDGTSGRVRIVGDAHGARL